MALLSTSGVIVTLCILLGLYIVTGRNSRAKSRAPFGAEIYAEDVLEDAVLEAIEHQDAGGSLQPSADSAPAPSALSASSPRVSVGKRGRLAIFGGAVFLLLDAVITALVAAFGAVNWWLPVFFLAFSALMLGLLRFWAVQDRNRSRSLSALYRSESHVAYGPKPSRDVSAELKHAPQVTERSRQALPVNHAVKALRAARTQHVPRRAPIEPLPLTASGEAPARLRLDDELPNSGWRPVEVPRPTYLDAPVVHAVTPEPLQRDTAPKSRSKTLAQAASFDLDDVLRRRRA